MIIVKRDGRQVEFDKERIVNAVCKAFKEVDGELTEYAKLKADNIANYIEQVALERETNGEKISIEEVQDLVEHGLMCCRRKDVAKCYILYRDKRTRDRQYNTDMVRAVREKLEATHVVNQNANVDERSFGGRKGEATSEMVKRLALDYCMSEQSRNNHLNNEIYTHDLDSYYVGEHNCLSLPIDDLLLYGFNTRQTSVRPANSVNTAFQLVAVTIQLQSLMQFGGVATTHIDWTMVPYVRRSFFKHYKDGLKYLALIDNSQKCLNEIVPDRTSIEDERYKKMGKVYDYALDMTTRETYQAVEGMFHNLNTLQSRSGNQLPFSSINYGTCTKPEGRMVTRAILEVSIKGIGKSHLTSVFPCQIFQMKKGVNRLPSDPNYDLYRLALESTAKRLYPNYANCDLKKQQSWVRTDREFKRKIIDKLSLSDYKKLVSILSNNQELCDKLFIILNNGKIEIDDTERPVEYFSTMG